MKNFIRNHPIIVMLVVFIASECGLSINIGNSIWGITAKRLLMGILILGVLYLLQEKKPLYGRKRAEDMLF